MATRRKVNEDKKKGASYRKASKKQIVKGRRLKSEDLFRRFADTVQAAIFIYRGDRNLFVNSTAESISGYNQKELLSMSFWDVMHPDFKALVKERGLKRQRGDPVPSRYEVKILRKDGQERWLDFSGGMITFEGERVAIGTAVDITERKRAEDQVRRNLDRIRILHEINLATSSTLELRAVLNILLEKIEQYLSFPCISTIRTLVPGTGTLEGAAYRNITEEDWRAAIPIGGRGLSRGILEKKAPVVITNALRDPRTRFPEFFRKYGLVSYLGLPLLFKDALLGDISLFTKVEHQFSEDEVEFLSDLAGQAATAVHNSQLYDELKRNQAQLQNAHRRLSALHAVTTTASQSLDLDRVLQEVIGEIRKIFYFDATRIYLFDPEMEYLHLRASYETAPELFSHIPRFRRGEGIVGKAAESEQPIIFEDIVGDPYYLELNPDGHLKNVGMRFFGAFPIKSKLRTLGAMSLGGTSARRLAPDEVQLISSITAQLGIAMENAMLYHDTAAKARELSALYSVAGIAAQYLEVGTLLRNVMHKVLEIFDFQAARIYLLDNDKKEGQLVAQEGWPEDVKSMASYRLGEGLVGSVLQTGEPVVIEDMQAPEYQNRAKRRIAFRAGFRSTFFVPIKVRGETLGVMNLLSKDVHSFTPSELQLINSIAYHLGIAVGNATLFFQLKQKTLDLERANRGKDEFLSVISHELRTPLNVIMGFAGMLHDRILGDLKPEQERALEKVVSHTKDLLAMVNGILQVTSLQAGAVRVELREISLGDFCDSLRLAYELPPDKKVTLEWNYPKNLPVAKTDGEKLKQILSHLVDNAIKFTEQGQVRISVRYLLDQQQIEFQVADTGIGITPKMIPLIFDMFRQADSSETRPYGGVGLGLYIAKQYAELLGGKIGVESEVGKGSTFTLMLPCQSP